MAASRHVKIPAAGKPGLRLAATTPAWANLRGVRESGRIFAIPTDLFVGSCAVMLLVGLGRLASGHLQPVPPGGTAPLPTATASVGLLLVDGLDRAEQDYAELIAASPAIGFLPKTSLSADAIRDLLAGRGDGARP